MLCQRSVFAGDTEVPDISAELVQVSHESFPRLVYHGKYRATGLVVNPLTYTVIPMQRAYANLQVTYVLVSYHNDDDAVEQPLYAYPQLVNAR